MGDVIFTNKNRFPYIINQSGFLINIISDKKINNNCVFLVHQLTPTDTNITGQVYQTLYNRAMIASKMGTGESVKQVLRRRRFKAWRPLTWPGR